MPDVGFDGGTSEQFRQGALAAWAGCLAIGLHATAEEMEAWLVRLETGENVDSPACHLWYGHGEWLRVKRRWKG